MRRFPCRLLIPCWLLAERSNFGVINRCEGGCGCGQCIPEKNVGTVVLFQPADEPTKVRKQVRMTSSCE